MDEMKTCIKCELEKINNSFFVLKKTSQMYTNKCKQCLNDKRREWGIKNIERSKSNIRQYFEPNK